MISAGSAHTLCIVALCHLVRSADADNCILKIRPETIKCSWQTSSYDNHCFAHVTSSDIGKPSFFHSDLDSDFTWFVVELKEVTRATRIAIVNRETGTDVNLDSRASDIEVWTSGSEHLNFGNERCKSGSIGATFRESEHDWEKCGRTPPFTEIKSGMSLPVTCKSVREARYILLRKQLSNERVRERKYMSFADMWIHKLSVKAELSPPGPLMQGSRVTVKCTKTCTAATNDIRVCRPRGECFTRLETHIDSLQPSDSGNYTCQIGAQVISWTVLSVQYPPAEIKISPSGPISCGSESPADVTFEVASSAAEPTPMHSCTATDSDGSRQYLMKRQSRPRESGTSGSVTSYWLCATCSDAVKLAVNCCANQSNGVSRSTEWKCAPPKEFSIAFGKVNEQERRMEIMFDAYSSASSPSKETQHSCNATAADAVIFSGNVWRSPQGATRTHWSAIIQLPWESGKLTVHCSALHPSAWSKQQSAVWQRQSKPASIWSVTVLASVGGGAVFVLLVACLSASCYCRMRKLSVNPMQLIRVAGAMTAMQAVPHIRASGQNRAGDNAQVEDEYDVVQKISHDNPSPIINTYGHVHRIN